MKKVMYAGLSTGLISGLAGILMFYLTTWLTGIELSLLNPISILIVSIIVNLIGAFLYSKLLLKTAHPTLYYVVIALSVALFLSLMDWAFPAEPHVGDIAGPVHSTVVTISMIWIPRWLRK